MIVKNIAIIGGGSAGWMTAAALVKQTPDINVTLIESSNIPKIGVGESTLGHINEYFDAIGLEDKDWMPACKATYKSSIQFTDFEEKDTRFQYPFGGLPGYILHLDSPQEYLQAASIFEELKIQDFAEYFNSNTILAKHNKLCLSNDIPNYNFNQMTAYHFNAHLFAEYLKDKICGENINHIVGTVEVFKKDSSGNIEKIILDNKQVITADLFIDCTGFKSLLLEHQMNVGYNSFNDVLLNDSAVVGRFPYKDKPNELNNVTDCKAMNAGWRWTIPLWDEISSGYVYSSKYLSKEEAEVEYRESWDARADNIELRHINIRHGVHDKAWEKNVVAIGLSFGFIEPLESTGLMTTHENILRLVDVLQKRDGVINRLDIEGFNHAACWMVDNFSKFVALHYGFSKRKDTPYWREVTENIEYDKSYLSLVNKDNQLAKNFIDKTYLTRDYSFERLGSILFICTGMGYSPVSKRSTEFFIKNMNLNVDNFIQKKNMWLDTRAALEQKVSTFKSSFEFLQENIYK